MSVAFRPDHCQRCKRFEFPKDKHVFGLCVRNGKTFVIDHKRLRDTCRFHYGNPGIVALVCTIRCPKCNHSLNPRATLTKDAAWCCPDCGFERKPKEDR